MLFKCDGKYMYNIRKDLFFTFEKIYYGFQKIIKHENYFQLLIILDDNTNDSWAPNQHIRMISEGKCDKWKLVMMLKM